MKLTDSVVIIRPDCEKAHENFQKPHIRSAIVNEFISRFRKQTGQAVQWDTDAPEAVELSEISPENLLLLAPDGTTSGFGGTFTIELKPSSS